LISATFTFHVNGDSYWELREKADAVVVEFLQDDTEEELVEASIEDFRSTFSIGYDMVIDENTDMEIDSDYRAEVTARVKPRR